MTITVHATAERQTCKTVGGDLASTATFALVAALTIAGLALRLAAARGDLWLDELWSLDLVSRLTSPDQVFWAISHDNNHFLNSLWLYAVGQDAIPLVDRLPAILFGTLTIPVSARLGGRVNRAGAVAGAALAACAYPLVLYGSEARGYAGLILASFCAIDLSEAALERLEAGLAPTRRQTWLLAIAVALGTCAHLTMLVEAALLGIVAIVRLKLAGRSLRAAVDAAVGLFSPSVALLLPVAGAVGVGVATQGEFTVGGKVPFTPARWLDGFGGLVGTTLGLPRGLPLWLGPLAATAGIAAAARTGLLDRRFAPLALLSLLVWPALAFAARLPNVEHPRYFLAAGLPLVPAVAAIAGRLIAAGGHARAAGFALVGLVGLGQVQPVAELLRDGRGAPREAVALMGRAGPATVSVQPGLNIEPIVADEAARQHLSLTLAGPTCREPADWLVVDGAAPELTVGPPCPAAYERLRVFPSARWSGQAWAIYRRLP